MSSILVFPHPDTVLTLGHLHSTEQNCGLRLRKLIPWPIFLIFIRPLLALSSSRKKKKKVMNRINLKRVLALNRNFPHREVSVEEGAVGRKNCAYHWGAIFQRQERGRPEKTVRDLESAPAPASRPRENSESFTSAAARNSKNKHEIPQNLHKGWVIF